GGEVARLDRHVKSDLGQLAVLQGMRRRIEHATDARAAGFAFVLARALEENGEALGAKVGLVVAEHLERAASSRREVEQSRMAAFDLLHGAVGRLAAVGDFWRAEHELERVERPGVVADEAPSLIAVDER